MIECDLQAFRQPEIADNHVGLGFAQIVLCHKGFAVAVEFFGQAVAGVGEKAFVAHMAPAADTDPMDAYGIAFAS